MLGAVELYTRSRALVLFDFDGTLADSIDAVTAATNSVIEHYGGDAASERQILHGMAYATDKRFLFHFGLDPDTPWPASFSGRVLPGPDQVVDEFYRELLASLDAVEPHGALFDLVRELGRAGWSCGIVSNNRSFLINRLLRLWKVSFDFDLVLGEDDVYPAKPHPQGLRSAMSRLGHEPTDTVYIGDGRSDALAAEAAGVAAIGLSWIHNRRGDVLPEEFSCVASDAVELRALLSAWEKRELPCAAAARVIS